MIGQTIGKYRVDALIGRGGMGTVYRATDETLNREVALKVLNAELNDPEIARRFRAEAVTVARLSHPGIATIYEFFQHEGQWLMVMEFVRGETLERLVSRIGPLSAYRAAELCMQALAALAHAHGLGVVHRDLKPANLMLNDTGVVKVMDFGIARVSGSEHLTHAGFMMGTPAYMAPEQVMGSSVDARADLYAMGVVFYRLVTGKLPFKGDTAFAMAQSQVNDPPTPVMLARPDLPPWVEPIVARALAKQPQERFQTAAELHETLARNLAGMWAPTPDDGSAATELMSTPTRLPLTVPVASPTPPAQPSPTPLATPAPVTPTPNARQKPTRMSAIGAIVMAVAVLVALGLAGRAWLRSRQVETPPAAPPTAAAQPPAAVIEPSRSAAPPVAGASDPARQAGPAPAGTVTPARGTVVPPGAAAPGTMPVGTPLPPADDTLAAFTGIKLLAVNGRRTTDRDVLVNFGGGQIAILPRDGGPPIATVPYARVRRATYVNGRNPRWDPTLSAPPADLTVGSFIRQSRNWLVVQTGDSYAILRVDVNAVKLIETLETRTGIKVDRPSPR
jgi:serine/threonine-protein kinase